MSTEIPQTAVLSEEEQVASILEHLPAETEIDVVVPTKGIFYFGKEMPIRMRPMTFDDEKSLVTGSRSVDFNAANYLLSRCLKNIEVDKLIIIDKLFLLIKLREISYGKDYKVGVICGNCNFENVLNLEIDKLAVKEVPEDFDYVNNSFFSDGIQKDIEISVATVVEEHFLQGEKLSDNIWRFIRKIGGIDNPTVIAQVIDKLPIADIHNIVKKIMLSDYGVQPQIRYACDKCTNSNLISLPIDENFFSVN